MEIPAIFEVVQSLDEKGVTNTHVVEDALRSLWNEYQRLRQENHNLGFHIGKLSEEKRVAHSNFQPCSLCNFIERDLCIEQKDQMKSSIEDLQRKLHDAQIEHKELQRRCEAMCHDSRRPEED